MRRVFNTFFAGIYRANLFRGEERAIADAALVTSAWLALVLAPLLFLTMQIAFRLFEYAVQLSGPVFGVVMVVVFVSIWLAVRKMGSHPLVRPQLDLDSFLKKRAFALACIGLPLVLATFARELVVMVRSGAI